MGTFLTVIIFVAILFFLVTCHEMGHFLASRRAGIIVEEFGIGFPPRLFSIKRGQTTYSINLIPVGAFVRPTGEDDPTVEGGLAGKGPWTRMGVYAAGPLVNVVLAFLFITAFYMGVVTTRVTDNRGIMVHSVAAGTVAEQAGIQAGDVILQIDDKLVTAPGDIGDALNESPGTKAVVLQRGGVELDPITVQPQYDEARDRYILGVSLSSWLDMVTSVDADSPVAGEIQPGDSILRVDGEWVYSRESFSNALNASAESGEGIEVLLERVKEDNTLEEKIVSLPSGSVSNGELAGVTTDWVDGASLERIRRTPWQAVGDAGDFVIHLPSLIKDSLPLIKQDPGSAFIGPVGAAQLTVEVVKVGGLANVLFLGGFISISLALFNFLPVPPLDGGGMAIALIEGIRRGKRLPQKAVRFVYLAGTALMIMLFVVVFYGDIARLISGKGFPGL